MIVALYSRFFQVNNFDSNHFFKLLIKPENQESYYVSMQQIITYKFQKMSTKSYKFTKKTQFLKSRDKLIIRISSADDISKVKHSQT